MNTPQSVEEILFWCSRCGARYQKLGRVLKWGRHYPAFTVKHADGTITEHKAENEIKEALCRVCAKEYYDNEKIATLTNLLAKHKAEVQVPEGKVQITIEAQTEAETGRQIFKSRTMTSLREVRISDGMTFRELSNEAVSEFLERIL